jgi:2,3-bisphosphoglycerate-independent phosphoglycerate mutase
VPVHTGKHTRTPVPVSIRRADWTPDAVQTYDELACPAGALGALQGRAFMDLLLSPDP